MRSESLEEVRFIFPTERSKDPEEKKEGYEFSSPKRCWSKGWFPRSRLHDHPGSCASSRVSSRPFLFPQVVNITDLKGLVLGQAFSIQWDLPVSDLQKFNCFPEQPAVSEESCRERGCLWEVRARSRLPQ